MSVLPKILASRGAGRYRRAGYALVGLSRPEGRIIV